jgi:hypothetical protein
MDAYRNFVRFTELGSIGLTSGEIARIDHGQGIRLRVEIGSIWVTEEPSVDDVCLTPGETYCISKPGKTVISTLRAPFALVAVEPAVLQGNAMPSEDFMSIEERRVLRQRSADERARYLARLLKAVCAAARTMASGAAPGGSRAAQ